MVASYDLCIDAICTSLFFGPKVILDLASPSVDGFFPIKIDTSTGFATKTLYIRAMTRGLVEFSREITIEVCGIEVISVIVAVNTHQVQ